MMLGLLVLVGLLAPSWQGSLVNLQPGKDISGLKPCKGKDVASCTVAAVDLSAFDDDVLTLPECGDMTVKNQIQEPLSRSGAPDVAKSVAYENEKGCEAVFSFRGGKVMGNVEYPDGRDFVLEPCAAFPGCHVWKEENTKDFVDGDGEAVPAGTRSIFSNRAREEFREQGISDSTTIATFSVKFYYTKEFAGATDDIELYMDQVTAETNQGYINSLIPIRMKIHCIEPAELNDIADGGEMLSTFRTYKSSVEELRGGADAAALILLDFNYCGIGYLDSWRNGWTVTAQTKGCALGYFTMGHELGHNFGAHHDREHTSSGAYDYGFGQYIGSGPYRTCMAYSKTGYNRKANIYSSPVATYQGTITGSATEDNARVIRENRFAMAAVGDESGTCDWTFSSTAAPTTGAPTTVPPTTVPPTTVLPTTVAPTTVPPTTFPPTFPPTTDFPGTFPPTTDFPGTFPPTTDFPGTFPPTTDFPGTFPPTTDFPTTVPPPIGRCRQRDVIYDGSLIGRARRSRTPKACERRCRKNNDCVVWSWMPGTREVPRRQRKRCALRSNFISVTRTNFSGAMSGQPSKCRRGF